MENFTNEVAIALKAWLSGDDAKAFIAETKAVPDSEYGTFEMVITTENVDRYQEVIKMDGWELDNYMKNPVVLWGHDHFTLPVGVTTSLEVIDGKMVAKGKFAPNDFAQQIRKNYDLGIIRASSVGFIEKQREGNLITQAELIEWSFVSVPANPFALSALIKAGHDVNALVQKGIFVIKEAEDAPAPEPVEEVIDTPDAPAEEISTPVDTELAERVASLVVAKLKGSDVVLDAPEETPAPEHDDNETAPTPDEVEKDLSEFAEKRRILQEAVTVLGDVLAETRIAIKSQGK